MSPVRVTELRVKLLSRASPLDKPPFEKLTLRQPRSYTETRDSTPSGLWKHEAIGRQSLRVLSPIADQGGADYQKEN